MRLQMAQTDLDPIRALRVRCAEAVALLRPCSRALAAGLLSGGLILGASAQAQSPSQIQKRIEATFDLVLSNRVELAVPLTRRALARRSAENDSTVEPLSYSSVEDTQQPLVAAAGPATTQEAVLDESEIARLPRPRPVITSQATGSSDLIGQPLDLVAGAAAFAAEEEVVLAVAPADGVGGPLLSSATATEEPEAEMAELQAAGACLSVGDVTDEDGDFKRNAEALSADGLCIEEETFTERKRSWIVQTVKGKQPGPLWAVMHDDEDLSFDNAVEGLKRYGGTLIAVETGGERNLSGIDPNRNFSADGIGCRKVGKNASPRFTGIFAKLMDPEQPIFALHNNTGKRKSNRGLGHVSMETVPKDMDIVRPQNPAGPLAGPRALVLLTDTIPVSTTSKQLAEDLADKGINAIIEKVRKDRGDCSLSNYAVLSDHKKYLNVTVDHDEREKQMRIVDVLMGREEAVASQ